MFGYQRIMVVKETFSNHGAVPLKVECGEVETRKELSAETLNEVKWELWNYGLVVVDDKLATIINKIKKEIDDLIFDSGTEQKTRLPAQLKSNINPDYNFLGRLFCNVKGMSIEKYFLLRKIDCIKECLVCKEMTLNDIASKLGFAGPSGLSYHFKMETGLTPGNFRNLCKRNHKFNHQFENYVN